MSLSRKEYVAICQTCHKSAFDKKLGIICSLTQAQADFTDECPDKEIDPLAVQRMERMERHKEEMSDRQSTTGSAGIMQVEGKMLKSGAWGGIGMIAVGIAWLFIGLANDWLFYYPIFLILGGLFVLIKASINKAKEINKPDTSEILDDHDDLEVM